MNIRTWLKKQSAAATALAGQLAVTGAGYAFGGGAALAIVLGKFILGGFLAMLCLGILLRLKRGRVSDGETGNP
jgi:hypothetical protein